MRIIIEGCDGTGKTTLANKLMQEYDLSYHHSTSVTTNDFPYHFNWLMEEKMVFDRFHYGEVVYANVFNRRCKIDPIDFLNIEEECSNDNQTFTFVLYSSDIDVLKERLDIRGNETEDVLENLIAINEGFIRVLRQAEKINKRVWGIDISKHLDTFYVANQIILQNL